ncbi:hypothetical protein QOT17_007361 [Balamuthia mandrillaris]
MNVEEKSNNNDTFGKANGEEISNKATVLAELDKLLNPEGKPPALELIFAEPYAAMNLGFGFSTNPYGHLAVRYTIPKTGESVVMNVRGFGGGEMVNFVKPEDYFFGTNDWDGGNEQGAIYNRAFVSARVERLSDGALEKLHTFFSGLAEQWKSKNVSYSMLGGAIKNWYRGEKKHGNCAYWVAMGLKEADILPHRSMWPKEVWLRLYRRFERAEKMALAGNLNVVSYRRIPGINSYGADINTSSWVKPGQWRTSYRYSNLDKLADYIIEVPVGTKTAQIVRNPNPRNTRLKALNIYNKLDTGKKTLFCSKFWTKLLPLNQKGDLIIRSIALGSKLDPISPELMLCIDAMNNVHRWNGSELDCVYSYQGSEEVTSFSNEDDKQPNINKTKEEEQETNHLLQSVDEDVTEEELEKELKKEEERETHEIERERQRAEQATALVAKLSSSASNSFPTIHLPCNDGSLCFRMITISKDKQNICFGLTTSGRVYRLQFTNDCKNEEVKEEDVVEVNGTRIVQIGCADENNLWALTNNGLVFHYTNTDGWTYEPHIDLRCIAVGGDGSVWGIGQRGQVYRRKQQQTTEQRVAEEKEKEQTGEGEDSNNNNNPAQKNGGGDAIWEVVDCFTTNDPLHIEASSSLDAWIVDREGAVYVWNEEEQSRSFEWLGNHSIRIATKNGIVGFISVNALGDCWALAEDNSEEAMFTRTGGLHLFALSKHRLQLVHATQFTKVWDDHGTGSKPYDVTFFKANAEEPGFVSLGDLAERSHLPEAVGTSIMVRELDYDPSRHPVQFLRSPVDFDEIWRDRGTGAKGRCTIYRPIPPEDYAALGFITFRGYDTKPQHSDMACVHKTLLRPAKLFKNDCLWSSRKSGAKYGHCSLWFVCEQDAEEEGENEVEKEEHKKKKKQKDKEERPRQITPFFVGCKGFKPEFGPDFKVWTLDQQE